MTILRSDNISFDINILEECMSEMTPIDDKSEFFNNLVNKRLDKYNSECINDYKSKLDMIERQLDPNNIDLDKLCKTIKSMSKLSTSLYKTQITLYKVL